MRGRTVSDGSVERSTRHDYWGVNIDAPDPHALARFYAELLEWDVVDERPDDVVIQPADGVAYIGFQREGVYQRPVWPAKAGRQQMQMHLDIEVSDLDAAVTDAIGRGAVLDEHQPQENVRVLRDPAGHPFCLYLGGV